MSNGQLKSIVERIENLDIQIKECREDQKEIYHEAAGTGYDVKVLRKVVAWRKKDANARAEEESLMESYLAELGTPV
jgi:uncharacterized protein (UPF0335 family)